MNHSKYISVFIPTYNGEKYITELLDALLYQDLPSDYKLEILVTDSGSTDNTVDVITANYADKIIFDQIPNSDFGHGKTRQRAADRAKGEFILFLSQDATPTNRQWIKNMIEPFYLSPQIGCVFGRQIPRTTASATIKREVSSVFGGLGAPDSLTIHREKSLVDGSKMNELNSFFSDVNSGVRKEILKKVPFRDVKYAEDQALAKDMQNNGYLKAYSVAGAVWHSNEYTVPEYHKRKFDEFVGLQKSIKYTISRPLETLLIGWIRPTIADWKFTIRDREYSHKRKFLNILLAPCYNFAGVLGRYHASKYGEDELKQDRFSLESSRKK